MPSWWQHLHRIGKVLQSESKLYANKRDKATLTQNQVLESFAPYLALWKLMPDGTPLRTTASCLLPVSRGGEPAMLKIALSVEEARGGRLMGWWEGKGAARVLAHDGNALLLERAEGSRSLASMARSGADETACRILCRTVATLHATRKPAPSGLVPLEDWFEGLASAAVTLGGIFTTAHATARELLSSREGVIPLHGDIHHDNVLDFGERGWLAIDPKGLIGEHGFDYANIFCNPDLPTATDAGHFARRVAIVADEARLDRRRLLQWILAWGALSASWSLEDGLNGDTALAVAKLAAAKIGSM